MIRCCETCHWFANGVCESGAFTHGEEQLADVLDIAAGQVDAKLVVREEYAQCNEDEIERVIDVAYQFLYRVARDAEGAGLWRERVRRPSEFCCNQWM